jgi:hypothetical protein
MAIVRVTLPKCDSCGEVWLPDKYIKDKSTKKQIKNPARDNPRLCKRCGKCKTPTWNKNDSVGDEQKESETRIGSPMGGSKELKPQNPRPIPDGSGLEALYGILEEEFKALGGGEAFLRAERAAWGPDPWEKIAMEEKALRESAK